ncbi:MAG: hypothetical protein ACSHX5_06035 [Phycisphaerales bacterium]
MIKVDYQRTRKILQTLSIPDDLYHLPYEDNQQPGVYLVLEERSGSFVVSMMERGKAIEVDEYTTRDAACCALIVSLLHMYLRIGRVQVLEAPLDL